MIHRDQTAAMLLGTTLLLGVIGCGGGGAQSPREVFDAAKAAHEKEDWKEFCNCLTEESVDELAGVMVMSGLDTQRFIREFGDIVAAAGGEEEKMMNEKMREISDVLKNHGLTKRFLERMKKFGKLDPDNPIRAKKALKELIAPIKDRIAFIADMGAAVSSLGDRKEKTTVFNFDGKLTNVKIDGDSASATFISTKDGKEKKQPVRFAKTNDGWKLLFKMPGM